MGFSIELSKKAIIKTKNQGVNYALDIIFQLGEEEEAEKASISSVNKFQSKLKPVWCCDACTYENTEENKVCEICQNAAPVSAFYTEDELRKEADN